MFKAVPGPDPDPIPVPDRRTSLVSGGRVRCAALPLAIATRAPWIEADLPAMMEEKEQLLSERSWRRLSREKVSFFLRMLAMLPGPNPREPGKAYWSAVVRSS